MGAVNAYKNLMKSKINIRMQQIQAGMSGVPYTGTAPTAPTGGPTNPTPAPGGSIIKEKPAAAIGKWEHNGRYFWVDGQGNNLGEAPKP